jgi:hypothetical protein
MYVCMYVCMNECMYVYISRYVLLIVQLCKHNKSNSANSLYVYVLAYVCM